MMWDFIERFFDSVLFNAFLGSLLITYSVGRFRNSPFKWADFFTALIFVWGIRSALKGLF